jgi:PAS domain S-box-containing protein
VSNAIGRPPAAHPIAESEHVYQLLVQSVLDYAIFVLDPEGHIRTWNPGAQRLKGYSRAEIVGQHFSIFYTDSDRNARLPEHELEVAAAEGRFEDEGWRVRRDGTSFWANVILTALRVDGELVGYAKVTRDLTERKFAETQRERLLEQERNAREAAEGANRAKADFLAAMSHELRTPLNAIAGYLQLLEMGIHGELAGSQADALRRIRRNQQYLLVLIEDLLQFTRVQSGHLEVRRDDVPVSEVVAGIEALVGPSAAARALRFECGGCGPELRVSGDRERIEQVLLNLISNALKFTAPPGEVVVSAHAAGDRVRFQVRDEGPGVAGDKLEKIFEPFVQVRELATPDSSRQGLGLGLAISRELARAMGGDLEVESVAGSGATFTLTLPAAERVAEALGS